MKNPLCRYEKFKDVVEFLKNNFNCYADHILVPYAGDCYFSAPLFSAFKFHLNFVDDEAYYFWKIFKEHREVLTTSIDAFERLPVFEEREEYQKLMFQETRPLFKALLFLTMSDKNYRSNYLSSLLLDLKNVQLFQNKNFDYSEFVLHSYLGSFSLTDNEKLEHLNKFKSKIVIADNPAVCKYINFDHKIDFEDCYIIISNR